ncbi:GM23418 [Drosophila sechellia]|uniref:GM23418 n=1 Tax=Drosophila sechellia TaxID=7238 RepID=B4INN3_DROSE|nr:GM23418 [Drosophila sechellia]
MGVVWTLDGEGISSYNGKEVERKFRERWTLRKRNKGSSRVLAESQHNISSVQSLIDEDKIEKK